MTSTYDVIIAGGGTSGVLVANRIQAHFPQARLLLLEREAEVGGRVRRTSPEQSSWSYGLGGVSKRLYDFLDQTLKSQAHDHDIEDFSTNIQSRLGVLAANKVVETDIEKIFDRKGVKVVGGAAAARDWTHFDDLLADLEDEENQKLSVGQLWKGKRKSPSAIVLEHLARIVGIPNVWAASGEVLLARSRSYAEQSFHFGRWSELYQMLMSGTNPEEETVPSSLGIDLKTNCEIANASYDKELSLWDVTTSKGNVKGTILVVAQSPWDAIRWLPKKEWPIELLNLVNKAKPVSVLTLTETLKVSDELAKELPEVLLIPAEDCQVVIANNCSEVIFQATLDYELSVQAPDVVKAVKRLKRARRKFLKTYPDCKLAGDHLALQPVAWAQPLSAADRKLVRKLAKGQYNSEYLAFCGDAYGVHVDGDDNIIHSVLDTCNVISRYLGQREIECQQIS